MSLLGVRVWNIPHGCEGAKVVAGDWLLVFNQVASFDMFLFSLFKKISPGDDTNDVLHGGWSPGGIGGYSFANSRLNQR